MLATRHVTGEQARDRRAGHVTGEQPRARGAGRGKERRHVTGEAHLQVGGVARDLLDAQIGDVLVAAGEVQRPQVVQGGRQAAEPDVGEPQTSV